MPDRITQLEEERDHFKTWAERLALQRDKLEEALTKKLDDNTRLQAENDHYRKTLERIAGHAIDWASEVSKRALKGD